MLTPERQVKAMLYGLSPQYPQKVLIGHNQRNKRYFDIYTIDLATGESVLLVKILTFHVDHQLRIRIAQEITPQGDHKYYQWKGKQWQDWITVPLEDAETTHLIHFDRTNSHVYLLDSQCQDTAALKKIDLDTGTSETLATDPRADVDIFMVHPSNYHIQAVQITYDKPEYKLLDKSIACDMAYHSDIRALRYYYYDRKHKEAHLLFVNKPSLLPYEGQLARMHPVIIPTRDNLRLVSYLTLPHATTHTFTPPPKPLPMILQVHDGPWARDHWGLNMQHQLWADRGYAVLSVNYRGSAGFGKDFVNAGNGEWGRKMHDDLVDAVHWAIKQHIAAPDKIAICGVSYGGYATLVGLTLTPTLFACGASLVGISNLITLIENIPSYCYPYLSSYKKRIGSWDTPQDREDLLQRFPLTFAHKIQRPLFITHSLHDSRVKEMESNQIVQAMRNKQLPVLYALYRNEGHGLLHAENKRSYFALLEHFFANILGGKAEPIAHEDIAGADLLLNNKKITSPSSVMQAINSILHHPSTSS